MTPVGGLGPGRMAVPVVVRMVVRMVDVIPVGGLGPGQMAVPVVVKPGLVDAAELLERYECGVVFGSSTPLGVERAADQLELLLNDPSTPDRCRSLAESHFDLRGGIDRLIAVYGSLKT